MDKALAIMARLEANDLAATLDDELTSRAAGASVSTWDQAAATLVARIGAIPDGDAPPDPTAPAPTPEPAIHVFTLDSLREMKQAIAAAGTVDLSRSGSTLTLKLPMGADDAGGIVANWPAVRDAALAKINSITGKVLARLPNDATIVDARPSAAAMMRSITIDKDGNGVVVSLDVVAVGQFLSDWNSVSHANMGSDDRAKQEALSREMAVAAKAKLPVNGNLTMAKVMADFAGGTLASVPSTQPVKPGTGLDTNP